MRLPPLIFQRKVCVQIIMHKTLGFIALCFHWVTLILVCKMFMLVYPSSETIRCRLWTTLTYDRRVTEWVYSFFESHPHCKTNQFFLLYISWKKLDVICNNQIILSIYTYIKYISLVLHFKNTVLLFLKGNWKM